MTTFVICNNPEFGRRFKSEYQITSLKTNKVIGNIEVYPECGQKILAENKNMVNVYHMGDSKGREFAYQCPECSNIKGKPNEHKYNMVKIELGETEVKCSNCGAILTRKIIQ
ncbi:MAG: hypothetical protein ACFFHD_09965 [Promethearchaeota archaeon]